MWQTRFWIEDSINHICSVRIDAEYRNQLSEEILKMQESGKLAALKIKWWKEKKGGGACQVRIDWNFIFIYFHQWI